MHNIWEWNMARRNHWQNIGLALDWLRILGAVVHIYWVHCIWKWLNRMSNNVLFEVQKMKNISFKWKWKGNWRNWIGFSAQTNWIVYNKWSQIYLNYPWPKKLTDRRLFVRSLQWLWLLGNLELAQAQAQVLIVEGAENMMQTRFSQTCVNFIPLTFTIFL